MCKVLHIDRRQYLRFCNFIFYALPGTLHSRAASMSNVTEISAKASSKVRVWAYLLFGSTLKIKSFESFKHNLYTTYFNI
jgi:hypothetical protein